MATSKKGMNMFSAIKRWSRRILRPPLHAADLHVNYVVLGTEYGGWPLLTERTNANSVIYSLGLGEDISFDLAAIDLYGCRVIGFDPTPKSRAWLAAQTLPEKFTFHPVGISGQDGEAEFFAPAVDDHVSFSARSARSSQGSSVKMPVMRLETIISRFGTPPPDILKMDIEGFEYDVIRDILDGFLRPEQLLVEFHHGMYAGLENVDTERAVKALRGAGYRLFFVSSSGREYGFQLVRPEH
jgi:FkbM family methyltransferase